MSKYFHPKNIAASLGKDPYTTISTSYSKAHGLYRQKQIDDEIHRILNKKKPSSSKITIIISPSNTNLLSMYHHHHHCIDIQLLDGKKKNSNSKGRVVWFWNEWETATDERIMKGFIAALDSTWVDPSNTTTTSTCSSGSGSGNKSKRECNVGSGGSGNGKKKRKASVQQSIIDSCITNSQKCMRRDDDEMSRNSSKMNNNNHTSIDAGEKRKRAALAAESRMVSCSSSRSSSSSNDVAKMAKMSFDINVVKQPNEGEQQMRKKNDNNPTTKKQTQEDIEVIDLVDSD